MSVAIGLSRILAVAGAAVVVASAGAFAADVPGGYPTVTLPPPSQETPLRRVEYSSGWYLRGDIGYRFQRTGESSSADTTQVPAPTSADLSDAFIFGFGAGIKQDWLRLDLTGDYGWRVKYNAQTAAGTEFSGKIDSFTVMGNAYVDLGTWYGLTPYVGAGLGAANVIFSGYQNPSAAGAMPSTAVPVQRWNFAWAVMAGVSYAVTRNVLIDVGYRHVDMGDVSGGPGSNLTVSKLTGDEIRIGFRYLLD